MVWCNSKYIFTFMAVVTIDLPYYGSLEVALKCYYDRYLSVRVMFGRSLGGRWNLFRMSEKKV